MSSPLTAQEEARYAVYIDEILAAADLATVSRKHIRSALSERVGKDLNSQKAAIKKLIEVRFDAYASANYDGDLYEDSHPQEDSTPDPASHADQKPKIAAKTTKTEDADADARLAAALQAQENQLAARNGARATRGATSGRVAKRTSPKKKKTAAKPKSAKRVRDEDDSHDEKPSDQANGEPKRKTGFQKPYNLSENLALLCGEPQLSRMRVVKKLWEHIKAHDLQDPSNKRQILCDDAMQAVFKTPKIDMFQMNKVIGNHLYPIED